MFYAQCDNIGSMYKLAVKVIDDVNIPCAGGHLHSHGIYYTPRNEVVGGYTGFTMSVRL